MNDKAFNKFIKPAKESEDILKAMLHRNGFIVFMSGQENWMPKDIHKKIAYEYNDDMIRAIRYMPDFLAFHDRFPFAWWEVKRNTTPGTANFTLEKACHTEGMARHAKGERVIIVYHDTNDKFTAAWIQDLVVKIDKSNIRQKAKGSRTPYLLILKSSTVDLEVFLNRNTK